MRTSPTRTAAARTPVSRAALRGLRALAPPIGFYLLTVALLAGVLGLDLAIIGAAGNHSQLVPAEVWGISAIVGCVLLYGLYAVRGANHRAEGLRVSRQQQPQLWRLVEQTARSVGVRAPHALWLTDDDGLAAWQNPRLLGLLPTRHRLSIGVPLLVGLTEAELTALLAHRLGPAADADTPLPALVRRNRDALRLVLQRYADTAEAGPGPRKWFGGMYAGYARGCLRWSAPDARRLEFTADRAAARVAGRDTTIAALRLAPALSELRQRYWHEFVLIGWEQDAFPPTAEVVPAFRAWLRGPVGQEELAALAGDPPRERIARYDARPPLAERIRRLEQLPAPASPSPPASPASPSSPSSPAELLVADPSRTFAEVVAAAPEVPGKRQLPWDDLAAIAGRAELDAAAAGLLTSVASVLRRRAPDLPTILDAIDEDRWAELADWIPRTGAARTVPVAVGRSLNLSTASQGLRALVLNALVDRGRARWTLDPRHGRLLDPDPDALDAVLGPALYAATSSPPDTAPLRQLLADAPGTPPESPPAVER
ncbi:M48 family metallopeptidase [Streptacidiphilus sp. P02-A3a]|uniref:M48 family metallopeptidase n=1 Tax=Streptacidiphilus sp. P02-A3a TaxID=2704468 RepID=UPI0015FCD771|nr:M48 family metallopeptidase [Streptacidiphilus sp. P02-A3a]QMU67633.1 hypothetical protein GXP74_04720 [Streptacidiphilus sp. P02-A3a]